MKTSSRYALLLLSFFYTKCPAIDLKNLPEPYCDLQELLPFNDHGWYRNDAWISKLFQHNQIKTAVEVGSWLGASTRHIASLLPNDGKLYAVDTWQGSEEHFNMPDLIKNLIPTLYEQFLSNIIHTGLTNKVIPIRSNSLQAATILKNFVDEFDLIYIDAAHDTISVLKDLDAYYPLMNKKSGILCGDDWLIAEVRCAVLTFAIKHQLSVYTGHNFWFFKKEDSAKLYSFIKNNSYVLWNVSNL